MTDINPGRTLDNMVPKKLASGMAVVVYIRPGTRINQEDFKAGLRAGIWFKAELRYWHLNGPVVRWNGNLKMLNGETVIIVRSTSYEDSRIKQKVLRLAAARKRK